jgi:hypothetical protein
VVEDDAELADADDVADPDPDDRDDAEPDNDPDPDPDPDDEEEDGTNEPDGDGEPDEGEGEPDDARADEDEDREDAKLEKPPMGEGSGVAGGRDPWSSGMMMALLDRYDRRALLLTTARENRARVAVPPDDRHVVPGAAVGDRSGPGRAEGAADECGRLRLASSDWPAPHFLLL